MARNSILRRTIVGSALCLAGTQLWAAQGASPARAAEGEQRYPYDPVCPWGRLADGRGMMVRCLKQDEVSALTTPAAAPLKAAEPVEAKPATAAAAEPPKDPAVAKDPIKDVAAKDALAKDAAAKPRDVFVDKVGPIVVDTGELPLAVKKLSEPKDRYLDCVNKNGGLQGDSAEVQVRFLVRERGRAEGVSVAKSKGMSAEAARCIADVVDRRYVGYPAAPIVGATLPIVLSARSK